jgi:aryl-alcohol dehydrogenase-like predicted oxidoreductase
MQEIRTMDYQQLGQSMLRISEIGFGCMSLGDDQPNNDYLLHRALDAGINFLDTADLYQKGWNEESVGKALAGRRGQVVLATKVGNQWRADGSGWDWNPRPEYILRAVEQSLQRLQTDYIDLYQLHGGTIDDPIDEIIGAFELLQQQGKIRYYGISSIRPNVIREYVRRSNIVSVMMQYSLLDRRPEESCLSLLHGNRIGVLARGSIAGGLLVNKPAKEYLGYTPALVQAAARAIQSFSGSPRSAAQTAIRWVLQHPAITAAVAGIRMPEQLDEVVATGNTPALTTKETEVLAGSIPVNYYKEHR